MVKLPSMVSASCRASSPGRSLQRASRRASWWASCAALSYDLDGYGDSTHLLLDYSVSDVGSGATVIEREASLRLVDDGGVTTWTLNFLKPMPSEGNGE